MNQERHLCTTV